MSLCDVLARFELSILENSYIKERHAILLHALAHARGSAASALGGGVGPPVPLSLALHRAVDALGLVARVHDINGGITVEALQSSSAVLRLLNDAVEAGLVDGGTASTSIEAALHAVLSTRFELADPTSDQLVYVAMVELERDALLAPASQWIEPSSLALGACALLTTAVDGAQSRLVRHAAGTALRSVLLSFAAETVGAGGPSSSKAAALLCVMHQLSTMLGAPELEAATRGDPLFVAKRPMPSSLDRALLPPPPTSGSGAPSGEEGEGGEEDGVVSPLLCVPPVLPDYALLSLLAPVPVTEDLSPHMLAGSGSGGVEGAQIALQWPAVRKSPVDAASPAPPSASPNVDPRRSSPGAPVPASPAASPRPSTELVRLRSVASGTPAFALGLVGDALCVLCVNGGDGSAGTLWGETAWVRLLRDRLCLALLWICDGVGARGGGGGLAGPSPTATSRGAVSMQLARLPLLSGGLRCIVAIAGSPCLRSSLAAPLELLYQRVIVHALSAPAKLAQACAVLMGAPAMRIIMRCMVTAQASRDSLARSLAASSGLSIVAEQWDQLPAQLTPPAVVKTIVASLASGLPGAEVDTETVRTLVTLLSPRSPLLSSAALALDALHAITIAHDGLFVAECFARYDATLAGSDVLRAVVQSCAGLALSHAHVHAVHGALQMASASPEGGGPPPPAGKPLLLPIPEPMQRRAGEVLVTLLSGLTDTPSSLKLPETCAWVPHLRDVMRRKRLLQSCARTFNAKPKRGVEALRLSGVLDGEGEGGDGSSAQAAQLSATVSVLHSYGASGGFSPVAVGEWLGLGTEAEDDAKRRAHVNGALANMAGQPLVSALRIYLRSFRLPGEAQQIDRILNAFAASAHTTVAEAGVLASIDATYLLSFSIIMLNTDAHNPNIKPEKRMSEEAFLRNNASYGEDISHGRRIPDAVLRDIYATIKAHPLSPPATSVPGVPLHTPAVDGPPTPDNTAAATSFAGLGDAITVEDYRERLRCLGRGGVGGVGAGSEGAIDGVPVTALHAVALPEVWHAAVRVALASFTGAFRALEAVPGSRPTDDGRPPAAAVELAIENARLQLQLLVSAAEQADAYGVSSGVDVILAALCRIAFLCLKVGSAASGAGVGNDDWDGEAEGAYGLRPGMPSMAYMSSPALFSSRGRKSGDRPQPRLVSSAAAFTADIQGQMALNTVFTIVSPTAQQHAVSVVGWTWILECLLRLSRIGVVNLGVLGGAASPPPPATGEDLVSAVEGRARPAVNDVSLRHLLHAYAIASSRFRHRRAVTAAADAAAAEAAASAAEAASRPTTMDASSGVDVVGGVAMQGGAGVGKPAPLASPRRGTLSRGSNSGKAGTSSSGDAAPGASSGGIGALFSWLMGGATEGSEDTTTAGGRGGASSNRDVNSSFTEDGGGFELEEVLAEEPDDDETESLGEEGEAADRAASLAAALKDVLNTAGVRVLGNSAAVVLGSLGVAPDPTLHRVCTSLLDLAGVSLPSSNTSPTSNGAAASPLPGGDAQCSNDDGAAFISVMETARYKCALLPPPDEHLSTSATGRLALRTLGLVVCAGDAAPGSSASREYARLHSGLGLLGGALDGVVSDTAGVTRRFRTVVDSALSLACTCLRRPRRDGWAAADDDLLTSAAALLWRVASLPAPFAGAARLLLAAALLRELGPSGSPALFARLWRLQLPVPAVPAGAVAALLARVDAWSPPRSGGALELGSEATVGSVLLASLVSCVLPSWQDESGTPPDPGLDVDELPALELTTATAERMALDTLCGLLALGLAWGAEGEASTLSHRPSYVAPVMAGVVAFLHTPPTAAVEADDVAMQAADALLGAVRSLAPGPGVPLAGETEGELLDLAAVLGAACTDPRALVRLHCIELLQLSLLQVPPESATPAQWGRIADVILFPLLIAVQSCSLVSALDSRGGASALEGLARGYEPRLAALVTGILRHALAAAGAAKAAAGVEVGFSPGPPLLPPTKRTPPASSSPPRMSPLRMLFGGSGGEAGAASAGAAPPPPASPDGSKASVRCERTVAAAHAAVVRIIIHALPVLLGAVSNGPARPPLDSALVLRLWRATLSSLDAPYRVSLAAQPPTPALTAALEARVHGLLQAMSGCACEDAELVAGMWRAVQDSIVARRVAQAAGLTLAAPATIAAPVAGEGEGTS